MSIHVVFYTNEPIILTSDFSGLEKEINDFKLVSDLIPENPVSSHHKWSEGRTYDFNDICAVSTAYNDSFKNIDCLEFSIPDVILVGATGFIDPFWALFVKRIKFKFEHFNQYVELPLIESGITLQQVMSDPVAMSKRIGNRIIIATDRKAKAVIKTVYDDRSKKFEEHLEREAEMIRSTRRKKKTTTITTTTKKTTIISAATPTVKRCELIPETARCVLDDIDYWDMLFNLPSEEQNYYGWEYDPQ